MFAGACVARSLFGVAPIGLAVVALCIGGAFAAGGTVGEAVVSVRACGAVGDGRADDTGAFRKAIDAVAGVGGAVLVDPVGPGGGYVLTETVTLPRGVSLIGSPSGMPFVAWEGVPRKEQRGPVILARPAPDQYAEGAKRPLFELCGGNTIRGLYILYDRQPWPSDAEFDDPDSPYYYDEFEELTASFIEDHVKQYGPTIYVRPGTASNTIEDVTCGRYWTFFYTPSGGKIVVDRCYLFGYGRAFALRQAKDVVRISRIHIVPNVERPISWKHAKLHAAITRRPGNIGFDFGSVDGYSVSDVTMFLCHTGFKLGASAQRPFRDPMTGEDVSFEWGHGPWGSMHNVKLDNVVVGFDCVTGTILPNQLTNVMVHVSIGPSAQMETSAGIVGRQAGFIVEPGFGGATLQVANLSLSSFAPKHVVATAGMVQQENGRAFLIDCPAQLERVDYASRSAAHVEIFGLVVSNIPDSHLFSATEKTTSQVRIHGFTHNGVNRGDCVLEAD